MPDLISRTGPRASSAPQPHVARGHRSPHDPRAARQSGTGVQEGPRVTDARACRRGHAAGARHGYGSPHERRAARPSRTGVQKRPCSGRRAPQPHVARGYGSPHERCAARCSRTGVPQGPRSGRAPRAAAALRALLRQSARAARRASCEQPHGRAASAQQRARAARRSSTSREATAQRQSAPACRAQQLYGPQGARTAAALQHWPSTTAPQAAAILVCQSL